MKLVFEQVKVGGDRNFGYLIGDRQTHEAALVDPSYSPGALVERANAQGLKIKYIINTHGHHDHVNGNEEAKRLTGGAPVAIYHNTDIPHDIGLDDTQELTLGGLTLRFLFTPGHYPDHMVIYIPEYQILLTGDHLFVGKVGGTKDEKSSRQEFESLQRLFAELPETATVWPGHDYGCRPSSTLAIEKASNPFLSGSYEDFLKLKADWSNFKRKNALF